MEFSCPDEVNFIKLPVILGVNRVNRKCQLDMTIVEGQIETLKKVKEALCSSGITRFNSIGEINHFIKNYETEKQQIPSLIESAVEAEIQAMHATLTRHQQICEELKAGIRNEIRQKTQELEVEIRKVKDKSKRSLFYKIVYFLKIKNLSRRKSNIEKNLESIIKERTCNAEAKIAKLEIKIANCLENKRAIISERCTKSFEDLAYTKEVVDGLYTLIAGAIGESSVVKALQQLSDDYYLFNDFSIKFDPPIYNKNEDDRIFSIQIDHLLVCQSGVFLVETKNWSRRSIENLDLRSPVKQILRTSYALFVLLNSDSRFNHITLEHHHWGSKKIPIRNVIVMVNEKPKEEFKHVKVLSLSELNGYIQYFEQLFSGKEVKCIFEYLKNRMNINP